MQTQENSRCDTESPSARVQDIRRQWALHEDEALAHRLQDEEILQHYAGNRTRNAIVREDGPRAREEQRREEEDALEQRLRHLSLLQRQAEEDARVAQELAKKYKSGSGYDNISPFFLADDEPTERKELIDSPSHRSPTSSKTNSSLLGASCLPSTSQVVNEEWHDEDDLRQLQEQRDAVLARKVQEELEQCEKDRLMAIEAQDRELAKVLYEKEKARLKRAKERSKLKAEAAAATTNGSSNFEAAKATNSDPDSPTYNENSRCKKSFELTTPPKIPDKSALSPNCSIGFKANPKKLPPQPHSSFSSRRDSSSSDDPVPPYMPIHGFNRSSPKRSK